MIEYINAAEAKKMVKQSLERMQTEFLDEIMPEIKIAAEQGKSSIHWYYQKDGYTYLISW